MNIADSAQSLTEALDALLPQTQCGQCGYAGCRPYAAAMAMEATGFNRCPPGGVEVMEELAQLLGRAPKALDTSCGLSKAPAVALIDESWCIGCTLCIQACPVDAIAGAAKVMHTVIADACTGCELCIPPCPVDCIQMVTVERPGDRATRMALAARARSRYLTRQQRIAAGKSKPKLVPAKEAGIAADNKKQLTVARALASARERIRKNNLEP